MIRWTQEELSSMREWDRQVERDAAPKRSPEGKARAKAQKAARYRAPQSEKGGGKRGAERRTVDPHHLQSPRPAAGA